ncbi:MAG: DUF5011 domain-containing protein, partial [Clostridia bacterium]|nr:DUF5011 domain-containing protein [Clostridia bacterium]
GTTWSVYNAPVVVTTNNTTVYARAKDAVGNISEASTITITNIDKIPPVITLNGNSLYKIAKGDSWIDPYVTATDDSGNVSVETNGQVYTNTAGIYTITYTARDNAGNTAQVIRQVEVSDSNSARYVIVEVYGRLGSNVSTITEIAVYDNNDSVIPYTLPEIYNNEGKIGYWTNPIWGKTNLNDNDIDYTNSSRGANSTTVFGYTASTSNWTRFVIDFGTLKTVKKISLWAGSPESRIPISISAYITISYNSNLNLVNRSDSGIKHIFTQTFSLANTYVQQYDYIVE